MREQREDQVRKATFLNIEENSYKKLEKSTKYVLILPDRKLTYGSNKKIYSKFRVMIIINHLILMESRAEKSLPQVEQFFICVFQSSFKGISSLKLVM